MDPSPSMSAAYRGAHLDTEHSHCNTHSIEVNRETKEKAEGEEYESDASDTFSRDAYDDGDEKSMSGDDSESNLEIPLTDAEVEEMMDEFLQVESKAAEAQEALEEESLARVERDVRSELSQSFTGQDLEAAVEDEMKTFKEEWESALNHLEDECALLLEQLDDSGIELPTLYKWIEKQAPEGCSTEAWKKRIHWAGFQATAEVTEFVNDAECDLQACRPVRRHHGKLLEEGASGFLVKKLAIESNKEERRENTEDKDWGLVDKFFETENDIQKSNVFGTKQWASVYLASTPEQAASMGLNLPGVDEVEEIDDIENCSRNPIYAAAVANEKEFGLTEEQKSKFRKVREEDDVKKARQMHRRLKRRRNESRKKKLDNDDIQHEMGGSASQNGCSNLEPLSGVTDGVDSGYGHLENHRNIKLKHDQELSNDPSNNVPERLSVELVREIQTLGQDFNIDNEIDQEMSKVRASSSVLCLSEDHIKKAVKRPFESQDYEFGGKRIRTVIIDSDDEIDANQNVGQDLRYNQVNMVTKPTVSAHEVVDVEMITDDEQSPSEEISGTGVCEESKEFQCTACGRLLKVSNVHKHPLLEVIVCKECKSFYESCPFQKDFDGSESDCRWCGQGGDVICCDVCEKVFCEKCIKRNFGEEKSSVIVNSVWHCFCCMRDSLAPLIDEYNKAAKISTYPCLSSDGDSMSSDGEFPNVDFCKRRKGRRIKRIIEDAELDEETKKKIAIEKERQDRLKMLQQRSMFEQWSKGSASVNADKGWAGDNEVLGSATEGYIVNVAREQNEEEVRVSPSISCCLKPHQIAGIRFMWENCIQSVNKIKSGDKGLGCILAHSMGLGKTLQVITFLYTIMRTVDLGLKTALIVTPVNVLHNWRQEFAKWRPLDLKPLPVFMLEDVSRENAKRAKLLTKWKKSGGVLLIGYAAFRNLSIGKYVKEKAVADEICEALQSGPDLLVCDEAHMIKNTKADITQALKQVKTQRRIALTGSPLQNNLMEYYCMVDFVREGFLGNQPEFRNRFQNPIENGQHANSTADDVKIMNQRSHVLYEQLKGFVQRMGMNVMKDELPQKCVYVISVKLSPLQRQLYSRFLEVHGFTTNDKGASVKGVQRRCFFNAYHSLAKIWNHPGLLRVAKEDRDSQHCDDAMENFLVEGSFSDDDLDQDFLNGDKLKGKTEWATRSKDGELLEEASLQAYNWWEDIVPDKTYEKIDYSGKMVLILDLLSMSSERGDKALVFSQSLSTLDLIEAFLAKLPRHGKKDQYWRQGKEWYRLDGHTSGAQRQKLVERFNDPSNTKVQCVLISTRAGSLGINLPAANRVIIVDGSWNPTHDLQALFRVWRFGQKKDVYAYRLLAHGTMEEKIYKRQVAKEGLAARVVDKQQVHRTMTKEDILLLFKLEDNDRSDKNFKGGKDLIMLAKSENTAGSSDNGNENPSANPHISSLADTTFMKRLLNKHYPSWIVNYHEHETLLQENEDERLSKEEQDMAWENFKKFMEVENLKYSMESSHLDWVQVATHPLEQNTSNYEISMVQSTIQKGNNKIHAADQNVGNSDINMVQSTTQKCNARAHFSEQNYSNSDISVVQSNTQKCNHKTHAALLFGMNIKIHCTTICSNCGKEVGWEDLVKRLRR
eukprot:Gb_33142 [translate_table: standard]